MYAIRSYYAVFLRKPDDGCTGERPGPSPGAERDGQPEVLRAAGIDELLSREVHGAPVQHEFAALIVERDDRAGERDGDVFHAADPAAQLHDIEENKVSGANLIDPGEVVSQRTAGCVADRNLDTRVIVTEGVRGREHPSARTREALDHVLV